LNRPEVSSHLIDDNQIKIRKKLNFVKNVGSAVLWISQKVPPFFGLTKMFRRSLDWSKRYAIIAQRYRRSPSLSLSLNHYTIFVYFISVFNSEHKGSDINTMGSDVSDSNE